jgi:hypothetical protein
MQTIPTLFERDDRSRFHHPDGRRATIKREDFPA